MNTPSNYLTSLAADINAALTREEKNREEWVAIKLDLCRLFADARARFKDDISFGKWRLKEIGNTVNDKDCTAYTKMGADLARAKVVLDKTTRSSVQLIYAKEFPDRSASVSGPAQKANKPSPETDKAMHVVERFHAEGKAFTRGDVVKEAGVSEGTAQKAMAAYKAVEEAEKDAAKVEDIILSASAQKRFDAKLKAYQKQLDATYQDKLTKAVLQWAEEYKIPDYLKTLEAMRKLLDRKTKGIMPRSDFTKIRACLHADSVHRSKEKLDEAFKLFSSHEDLLVMDKQSPMIAEIFEMPLTADAIRAARRRRA